MSTLTSSIAYDTSATCDTSTDVAIRPARRGFWKSFSDALIASRMRHAEREIRQYRHLIPRELEQAAAWRITNRSEDSLPFVR